jgi:hypothetical protein
MTTAAARATDEPNSDAAVPSSGSTLDPVASSRTTLSRTAKRAAQSRASAIP